MNEPNNAKQSSPGRVLRAAREELGFSTAYVGDALHLRSSVVEDIESESYANFSSTVFLKGYVRSYCRMLSLNEDRIVELLEAQLASAESEQQETIDKAKKAKQSRKLSKVAVISSLALFIVAIAYSVYIPQESITSEELDHVPPPVDTTFRAEKSEDKEALQSEPNQALESVSEPEVVAANGSPVLQEPVDLDTKLDTDIPATITPQTDLPLPQTTEDTGATTQVESIETETTVSNGTSDSALGAFKAEFTGDCWFTLADGSGKKVIAALKREGQVVNHTGPLPFHIVLGDASVAQVSFNQEVVDLAPYTRRNGRAEFELGLSESSPE